MHPITIIVRRRPVGAERAVPVGVLPPDDGSVAWERATFDDPRLVDVYDRMAPDHDGWLDPDEGFWRWRAIQARKDTKVNRYVYVGVRDGEPVAAVQYAYGSSERAMYRIDVDALHGVDGAAVRAGLAFLGGNGTTAEEVRTTLPPLRGPCSRRGVLTPVRAHEATQ